MKLEFRKLGINGEGIGYLDRKPVFCPGVFPGETAEVKITEDSETLRRSDLRADLPVSEPLRRLSASADESPRTACIQETAAGRSTLEIREDQK